MKWLEVLNPFKQSKDNSQPDQAFDKKEQETPPPYSLQPSHHFGRHHDILQTQKRYFFITCFPSTKKIV